MKRFLVGLLLSFCLLLPASALGQAELQLSRLTVSFWPEFDQAAVLVIYQAELPPEAALPATVTFPLPAGVEAPHAVANATATGELINASYELNPTAEGQVALVQAETSTIWFEFYQDLQFNGSTRSFSYQWPGTVAAAQFEFEVQQPVGAEALQIIPAPQAQRVGSDGLTYLAGSFGSVAQGQSTSLEFSYQKEGEALSAGQVSQSPLEGVSLAAPLEQGAAGWILPALVGLGLALLVAGAYFFWQRRRVAPKRRRRRRRRPSERENPGGKFCQNCGQQVKRQDRFCRNCGAELRPG
jgi:ribosomal protein L32